MLRIIRQWIRRTCIKLLHQAAMLKHLKQLLP